MALTTRATHADDAVDELTARIDTLSVHPAGFASLSRMLYFDSSCRRELRDRIATTTSPARCAAMHGSFNRKQNSYADLLKSPFHQPWWGGGNIRRRVRAAVPPLRRDETGADHSRHSNNPPKSRSTSCSSGPPSAYTGPFRCQHNMCPTTRWKWRWKWRPLTMLCARMTTTTGPSMRMIWTRCRNTLMPATATERVA